jgi:cytochrome P450
MISFRAWAIYAVALSGVITNFAPAYSILQSYTWTAIAIFLLGFVKYEFYRILLYPHFFSPLRHLPEPEGGSFFYGHWMTILKEPLGSPHRRWINSVPNEGIIRYRSRFNEDRILLTSPKAIAEAAVEKSYHFTKSNRAQTAIKHFMGNGLLASEGDEHRVSIEFLLFLSRSLIP